MGPFKHNPQAGSGAPALAQRASFVYKKYFDKLLRVEGKTSLPPAPPKGMRK